MARTGFNRGVGEGFGYEEGLGFVVVVVAILLVVGGKWAYENFTVQVPTYAAAGKVVWLEQNWTAEQRDWFYHAEQGTQTFGIPYEWFIALEQPALSLGKPGLLSDPQYLDRYGFIPSEAKNRGKRRCRSVLPSGRN